MNTFEIVIKVIPIIIAIILGYFLARINFLKDSMIDACKKVIVNVTLPAGLFIAFIKIRFQIEYTLIILSVFTMCVLIVFIGKLIVKIFRIKSPYLPFLITGFEAGMMGYALFTAVYGADAATDVAVVDIGHIIFVFLVFVPMAVNINNREKGVSNIKASLLIAIKSPVIWSILLGLIGSLSGVWAYQDTKAFMTVENIFTLASAPTAFLICLVIGSGLKLSKGNVTLVILTAVSKVIITLLFAFIVVQTVFIPLGISSRIITAFYAMCCLPAPFILPIYMNRSCVEDVNYVSNTLSVASIIGVICFSVVVLLS